MIKLDLLFLCTFLVLSTLWISKWLIGFIMPIMPIMQLVSADRKSQHQKGSFPVETSEKEKPKNQIFTQQKIEELHKSAKPGKQEVQSQTKTKKYLNNKLPSIKQEERQQFSEQDRDSFKNLDNAEIQRSFHQQKLGDIQYTNKDQKQGILKNEISNNVQEQTPHKLPENSMVVETQKKWVSAVTSPSKYNKQKQKQFDEALQEIRRLIDQNNNLQEKMREKQVEIKKISKLAEEYKQKNSKLKQFLEVSEEEYQQNIEKYRQKCMNLYAQINQMAQKQAKMNKNVQISPDKLNQNDQQQVKKLTEQNKNLRGELEFCQYQLRQLEETEKCLRKELSELKQKTETIQDPSAQPHNNKNAISPVENIGSKKENNKFRTKYRSQIPANSPKTSQKPFKNQSYSSQIDHSKVSSHIDSHHAPFLSDCKFIGIKHRQFLYQKLQSLLSGTLSSQKIYNSNDQCGINIHHVIDKIPYLLVLIELKDGGKVIGAYTQQPFCREQPASTNNNIAFIFDISNYKCFPCQSGQKSISYNEDAIIWGMNQIMLKVNNCQILHTNFCRKNNIYWDGKYNIKDFIGEDRQWARLKCFQVFRIIKQTDI